MNTLTPGELEIMEILWKHGPLKPAEIQGHFPRPIKNAAVRAALRILVEKGHVTREKQGKAFFYKAKTPSRNTFQKMIRRITDVFCEGSPAMLIAQLMETETLSEEEIKKLKQIANQKIKEKNKK